MKKRRRQTLSRKVRAQRKRIRENMRFNKIVDGLGVNLTVKQIHFKTGMSEKNIRKIMLNNPKEMTYLLLKRQVK